MCHSLILPLYHLCHSDQREESALLPAPFALQATSRLLNRLTRFRNDKNFRKAGHVSFPRSNNPVSYPARIVTSPCPIREAAAAAG